MVAYGCSAAPRGAAVPLGYPAPLRSRPPTQRGLLGGLQAGLGTVLRPANPFVVRPDHLENAASSLGQSDSHLAGLSVSLGCADVLFLLYF